MKGFLTFVGLWLALTLGMAHPAAAMTGDQQIELMGAPNACAGITLQASFTGGQRA